MAAVLGTFSQIREFFAQKDCENLFELYEQILRKNGGEHLELHREPDESYNPLPARIAQILIKSEKNLSLETLQVGMEMCVKNTTARKFLAGENVILNSSEETAAAAYLLDRLWHFHQLALPIAQKRKDLAVFESILPKFSSVNSELQKKLSAAFEKQLRRIGDH